MFKQLTKTVMKNPIPTECPKNPQKSLHSKSNIRPVESTGKSDRQTKFLLSTLRFPHQVSQKLNKLLS